MLPAKLNDLLASVECKDLYEFLKLDPSATPTQLSAAAQKEFDRIQNKGLRGGKWDARKELTGLCRTVFKDGRTKREYDRVIEEAAARSKAAEGSKADDRLGPTRGFDEETALLESGWELIRRGRAEEALVLAKRLAGDRPLYSTFRLAVAEIMIARERYMEAIQFIFWCEDQEPGNDQYKAMLGIAFAKCGTHTWTKRDSQVYATSADHITEAKACLDRARECSAALQRRDDELSQAMGLLEESIRIATRRKWNGNTFAAVGGVLFPQLLFGVPAASPDGAVRTVFGSMGFFMLASTAVYVFSSMDPQWKLNARNLQGETDGWPLYLVKGYLILMFLPVVAAVKFCTNFWPEYKNHPSVTSAQERATDVIRRLLALLGRGVSVLVVIGITVLLAAALRGLLPGLNVPITESRSPPGSEEDVGNATNGAPVERSEPSVRPGGRPARSTPPDGVGSVAVEGTPVDRTEAPTLAPGGSRRTAVTAGIEDRVADRNALTSSLVPEVPGRDVREGPRSELSPTARPPQAPQGPVRVGGNVTAPTKLHHVPPVYPPAARRMRTQGVVILETVIGRTGDVEDVRVLRSVPLLDDAAITAVRQWRYSPTLLNEVPVPVVMTVTVNFTLQ